MSGGKEAKKPGPFNPPGETCASESTWTEGNIRWNAEGSTGFRKVKECSIFADPHHRVQCVSPVPQVEDFCPVPLTP